MNQHFVYHFLVTEFLFSNSIKLTGVLIETPSSTYPSPSKQTQTFIYHCLCVFCRERVFRRNAVLTSNLVMTGFGFLLPYDILRYGLSQISQCQVIVDDTLLKHIGERTWIRYHHDGGKRFWFLRNVHVTAHNYVVRFPPQRRNCTNSASRVLPPAINPARTWYVYTWFFMENWSIKIILISVAVRDHWRRCFWQKCTFIQHY